MPSNELETRNAEYRAMIESWKDESLALERKKLAGELDELENELGALRAAVEILTDVEDSRRGGGDA